MSEPFRAETLAELIEWLERYVERYLSALEERGEAISRALRALRLDFGIGQDRVGSFVPKAVDL